MQARGWDEAGHHPAVRPETHLGSRRSRPAVVALRGLLAVSLGLAASLAVVGSTRLTVGAPAAPRLGPPVTDCGVYASCSARTRSRSNSASMRPCRTGMFRPMWSRTRSASTPVVLKAVAGTGGIGGTGGTVNEALAVSPVRRSRSRSGRSGAIPRPAVPAAGAPGAPVPVGAVVRHRSSTPRARHFCWPPPGAGAAGAPVPGAPVARRPGTCWRRPAWYRGEPRSARNFRWPRRRVAGPGLLAPVRLRRWAPWRRAGAVTPAVAVAVAVTSAVVEVVLDRAAAAAQALPTLPCPSPCPTSRGTGRATGTSRSSTRARLRRRSIRRPEESRR